MTDEQLSAIAARAWGILNASMTPELGVVAAHALHARIEGALREQAMRHEAEVARLRAELETEQQIVADVLQDIYLEWRDGAKFENMPLAVAARIELRRMEAQATLEGNSDDR
jgi:tellurite resistance protein